MNIKCSFCQMPYTLSRIEMLDALQEMDAGKLNHYDAHCPRCRRATPIQRARMEAFFPNWRDALKEYEAELKAHPQQEAPLPASKPDSVTETDATPAPASAKAESKPTAKKPAASKKAPAKSTAKKPARKR